jgi:hypothetical protein
VYIFINHSRKSRFWQQKKAAQLQAAFLFPFVFPRRSAIMMP